MASLSLFENILSPSVVFDIYETQRLYKQGFSAMTQHGNKTPTAFSQNTFLSKVIQHSHLVYLIGIRTPNGKEDCYDLSRYEGQHQILFYCLIPRNMVVICVLTVFAAWDFMEPGFHT